jgi:hypothetical protein
MGSYPSVKATANGPSAITNVNPVTGFSSYFSPPPSWSLGLICTVSPGASLTYAVQVTADQVPSANGNWNNHDVVVGQTASVNSNIAYPVTGVRLNVTNYISGSIVLGIATWP